jgi:hypothetical protein
VATTTTEQSVVKDNRRNVTFQREVDSTGSPKTEDGEWHAIEKKATEKRQKMILEASLAAQPKQDARASSAEVGVHATVPCTDGSTSIFEQMAKSITERKASAKRDSAPPVVEPIPVDLDSEECEGPPSRSVSPNTQTSRANGQPQSDDGSTNRRNKDDPLGAFSDAEESQSSKVHGKGYRRAPKTMEPPAANQWPSHKRPGLTVKAAPAKGSSIAVKQNIECTVIS